MSPVCLRCGAECSAKYGRYLLRDNAQVIQLYRCTACFKCHSSATHTPTYRQMMRDDIKRLTRQTWCTTKRASALNDVIAIYIHFRNSELIPTPVQHVKID